MTTQADLFGANNASSAPQDLVRISGPAATLSKAQKDFNRLIDRITRLRTHLAQWETADAACHQRAATELAPLQQQLTVRQSDAVLWIDTYLARPPQGERLPKALRAKLVVMLRMLATAVLQAGAHAEVEAAHDRHSPQSHREAQQNQADLAAAVLGQAMGDDSLFDGDASSVDELLQRASQRLQAQRDDPLDHPSDPAPGQRSSREDKARARDSKALQEASQSVREVYRRLASSLHPDRETDAAERERKTLLMAKVNTAYASNDLLALLTVQMEIEQIDAEHLAGVPDTRLRHYVRVLKEQQQVLEAELAALQLPVAEERGTAPGLLAWPAMLLRQALDDDLHRQRQAIAAISEDMQVLRDPRTRLAFLRSLQVDDPDEALDPFEELLLMGGLSDVFAPSAAKAGRRRKR